MPWDNKNNGPWNGGNNPWGKKDNNNSNNNWNPKNKGDDLDKMLNQFKEKLENFFQKDPKVLLWVFWYYFFYGL